ncbi:MAG TPA: RNA methyltransferase [Planctomycetaceae bacterium]|jgi:23S rRNA (guanosine2251-2'-O)-methyltransferase
MVERSRRGKRKHDQQQKLLGNHARCWIWGRNLVRETLIAGRWPIVELHLAETLPEEQLDEARAMATRLEAKVRVSAREALQKLAHTSEHQGYLAKMGPFPYTTADDLLAGAPRRPLYLVLDSIQDPYNYGAMLRSAGAFAVDGVFVGGDHQVPVTSMVARSSAGVVNRMPIAQVENLVELARTLHERRIAVVGASEKADEPLTACDFLQATAIVIGNEGAGIRPDLLKCCHRLARIPIDGAVGSLNAAAAAAVFCFEAQRQRENELTKAGYEP